MSKRSRDITEYYIQTLSQQLAKKFPYLSDYACNVYADKLAQIDFMLEFLDGNDPEEKELKDMLLLFRKRIKLQGEALWFMQAGELTNLGLKLGSTIRESKWNPQL